MRADGRSIHDRRRPVPVRVAVATKTTHVASVHLRRDVHTVTPLHTHSGRLSDWLLTLTLCRAILIMQIPEQGSQIKASLLLIPFHLVMTFSEGLLWLRGGVATLPLQHHSREASD